MAGLGFDAAIMRDAPEGLKKAVGWPAYVVSAAKHLRGRGIRVTITLDDGKPLHRRVRTVVVGNVGKLQGNIPLLPDAKPDDGILDVVVIATRNVVDWARVTGRVVRRADVPDRRMERFTASTSLIEASHTQPRQLDGDVIEDGEAMDIRIEPGALTVRWPPSELGDPGAADPHDELRRHSPPTTRTRCCGTTAGCTWSRTRSSGSATATASATPGRSALQLVLSLIPLGIAFIGLSSTMHAERPGAGAARGAAAHHPGQHRRDRRGDAGAGPAAAGHGGQLALWLGLGVALVALTTSMGQVERGANRIYGIQRDRPALQKYGRAVADGAHRRPAVAARLPDHRRRRHRRRRARPDATTGRTSACTSGRRCASRSASCWRSARSRSSSRRSPRRRQPGWSWVGIGAGVSLVLWIALHLRPLALRRDTAARSGRRTARSPA